MSRPRTENKQLSLFQGAVLDDLASQERQQQPSKPLNVPGGLFDNFDEAYKQAELRVKAIQGLIYDDEYTGPRFRYGFRNRPFGIGCQPKGFIIGSQKPGKYFRYGSIDYPFELTKQDQYDYELTRLEIE